MTNKKTKQERTIIHLEIEGKHYYFGSIAAIFSYFDKNEIGIGYGSLRNYGLTEEKPYTNSRCIIRKSKLLTKSSEFDEK